MINLVHDQPDHEGLCPCEQSKNTQEEDEQQLNWNWKLSSIGIIVYGVLQTSKSGILADTHVYKKVAEAKLTSKQNPKL